MDRVYIWQRFSAREMSAMTLHLKKKRVHVDNFDIFIVMAAVVRLVLMGIFSSDYQNKLFLPFVSWFVAHGSNPYDYFVQTGISAFPYPPVMLLMESAGAFLIQVFDISSVFMQNLVFKMPGFLIDFAGLHFLVKLFPQKRRYAAVVWYASPIVLYAVYMHGQLDLIPTVFLLGAVSVISSKENGRHIKSALLMVLALLSKLHVIAALPLVLMYLYKRDGFRRTIYYAFFCFMGTLIGMLPFLSDGFCRMVLFNEEQKALTYAALKFSSVEVYAAIAAVVILYLSAFRVNMINRSLFLSMCGMVFSIFLILCPPMPGWYVWVVPYMTFFFMDVDMERYKNIFIYMFLNLLYLIYFVFFHNKGMTDLYFLRQSMSFIKITDSVCKNIIFTLLSALLLYIIASMYYLGITRNSLYKRRNFPFTIGIAGDSGSGKSTLIQLVKKALGENNLLYIEGDGDHRWERGDMQWKEFTHLNPKANYLYRQAQDLRQLRLGNAVRRVEYDHSTGRFTQARRIRPKNYVMLCGLHAMYLPQTRKYLDLKIYMDIDEQLRRYWKIQRDMQHRGYSEQKILQQVEERMQDAAKYIYPQRDYADMRIRYYDSTLQDGRRTEDQEKISLCITVSAAMDIEAFVQELGMHGIAVKHDYSDDLSSQTVDIDAGDLSGQVISAEKIAEKMIPQLEEITRENLDTKNNLDTIIELFVLMCISSKMRGEI